MAVLAASRLTGIKEERKKHDDAGVEGVVEEGGRRGRQRNQPLYCLQIS